MAFVRTHGSVFHDSTNLCCSAYEPVPCGTDLTIFLKEGKKKPFGVNWVDRRTMHTGHLRRAAPWDVTPHRWFNGLARNDRSIRPSVLRPYPNTCIHLSWQRPPTSYMHDPRVDCVREWQPPSTLTGSPVPWKNGGRSRTRRTLCLARPPQLL